jgi:AraC-like DNA-binding protein
LKEQIKKYHLSKESPGSPEFGMHHFNDLKDRNLCLSQQPHSHSFYQIIWFKNNYGKHFIDFEGYKIHKNTLFFVAKNQVHFFEQNIKYDGFLIHFNESFILSNETDINFFLTYHIFNSRQKPYYQIPDFLEKEIINYFNQIENELSNTSEFGNSAILSNLLKSLLLVIEREIRKEISDNPKHNQNEYYLKFRNLLESNFKKGWSISKYAEELAISTKTLNTLLKSETGKTVSQLVNDRIILEAKRQLTHTNSLINQIAYDLGFQDPYYFLKYFKKHVKCSPTEFRNSIS